MLAKEVLRHTNSGDRATHLEEVRTLFNELFDIEEDADFYHHDPAPKHLVEAFIKHGRGGPSFKTIKWAAENPAKNTWNKRIAAHLAQTLMSKQVREKWRQDKKPYSLVEEASLGYWTEAVLAKFVRMRRFWTKSKARVLPDPFRKGKFRLETQEETTARMEDNTHAAMEEHRTIERRGDVSYPR
jgi:hypothetical protein